MALMKRVPLHLENIPFSQRNLGYIHIPLTTFRIIIYYSIGLKLLSLAPLSSLSVPLPLPNLVEFSPPYSFFMVGLHANDVVILIIMNTYMYKTGSWPLTSRLSRPNKHISLLAYNTWLTSLQNMLQFIITTGAQPWDITFMWVLPLSE
jgi:hypothetical protein